MKRSQLIKILFSLSLFLAIKSIYLFPLENISQKAVRVKKGPAIDGDLSDEAWKLAEPFSGFTQVFPANGSSPTEKTELRILFDAANLYLGIYCYDREPDKIAAHTMSHDADDEGESDDCVKVLIDPFLDRRNAYL